MFLSMFFFSLIRHSFLDLIIHFFYFIVFCSAYLEVFFHDLRYVFTVKSVVLNLQQRSKFKHIIQGNIFVYLLLPLTAVLMAESWTRFSDPVSRFDKFPHENQQGSAVLHRKTDTASYLYRCREELLVFSAKEILLITLMYNRLSQMAVFL